MAFINKPVDGILDLIVKIENSNSNIMMIQIIESPIDLMFVLLFINFLVIFITFDIIILIIINVFILCYSIFLFKIDVPIKYCITLLKNKKMIKLDKTWMDISIIDDKYQNYNDKFDNINNYFHSKYNNKLIFV
jgi:hypothetical protein